MPARRWPATLVASLLTLAGARAEAPAAGAAPVRPSAPPAGQAATPPSGGAAPAPPAPAAPDRVVGGTVLSVDQRRHAASVAGAAGPVEVRWDRNTLVYLPGGATTPLALAPGCALRAGLGPDGVAWWIMLRTGAPPDQAPATAAPPGAFPPPPGDPPAPPGHQAPPPSR
ncbi:MAG: hypothetical protein IPO09_08065 [Anaeromyxobacter sp.]|nr:hypothetical protein [Anaeromyxobacter sp.]MBL0277801.1 hypothetical protein [Anaeromyxobacter sp.]